LNLLFTVLQEIVIIMMYSIPFWEILSKDIKDSKGDM